MSPRLHLLALTRWDRVILFADRVLGFQPQPPEPTSISPEFRPKNGQVGAVKALAQRLIETDCACNYKQAAAAHGVDPDSLRAAVWRLRKQAQPKRRAVA